MMKHGQLLRRAALAATLLLLLAGCASRAADRGLSGPINDPLEPVNRVTFAVNTELERYVLKPVARGYRTVLPLYARDRVRGLIDNLNEPLVFANNLLQFRFTAASKTLARLIINTFLGLGGMYDVAADHGVPKQTGDFGQTLFVWGADPGFYLVLPVFGPSNLRDGIGFAVDSYADPPGWYIANNTSLGVSLVRPAVDGIDLLSRNIENLEQLQREALDYYALMRSVSHQRRQGVLRETLGLPSEFDLEDPGATP